MRSICPLAPRPSELKRMLTLSSLGGCSGDACELCLPAVLSDSVAAALGVQDPQHPAAPVAQHQQNVAMETGIPTTKFCLNLMQLLWRPSDDTGQPSALDGHRNACPGQRTVITGPFGNWPNNHWATQCSGWAT